MKRIIINFIIGFFFLVNTDSFSQSVGIGTTTPENSALLDVNSTTKGFLPPRMNNAQRNAIVNPVPGLIIYNTSTNSLEIFGNTRWSGLIINQSTVKKLIGGSGSDIIRNIFPTNDGGFVLAGFTNSSNTGTFTGLVNSGGQDGWIIKLDATGKIQWQKLLGGSGLFDFIYDIQPTNDGGFILCGTANSSNTGTLTGITNNGGEDGWLIKIDANGNTVWQKLFGGSDNDYLYSVFPATDGGFVIAGSSYSSNTGTLTGLINHGAADGWLMKTDLNGNLVWQKLFGGDITDLFYHIISTDGGALDMAGSSSSNSGTGTLAGLTNNGLQDGWILKTDSLGNILWQKLLGGSAGDNFNTIQVTADNNYLLAGSSASSNTGTLTGFINNGLLDGWLVKTDTSGNILWQKLSGGADDDKFISLLQTSDGGFVCTGISSSSLTGTLAANPGFGASDGWLLKASAAGTTQWQKLAGGNSGDEFDCIIGLADGSYIIAGISASPNNGVLTGIAGYGGTDIWLLKIDMYGTIY